MYTKRYSDRFPYCNHIPFFHIIQQFGHITQDTLESAVTRSTTLTSNEISHLNLKQLHYMRMNIGKMAEDFRCVSPSSTQNQGRRKRLIERLLHGY